jgi:hypothetical protein
MFNKQQCTRNTNDLTNGGASSVHLVPFASNSPCELHIIGHDGLSLGENGAEVGVLE